MEKVQKLPHSGSAGRVEKKRHRRHLRNSDPWRSFLILRRKNSARKISPVICLTFFASFPSVIRAPPPSADFLRARPIPPRSDITPALLSTHFPSTSAKPSRVTPRARCATGATYQKRGPGSQLGASLRKVVSAAQRQVVASLLGFCVSARARTSRAPAPSARGVRNPAPRPQRLRVGYLCGGAFIRARGQFVHAREYWAVGRPRPHSPAKDFGRPRS